MQRDGCSDAWQQMSTVDMQEVNLQRIIQGMTMPYKSNCQHLLLGFGLDACICTSLPWSTPYPVG